MKTYFGILIVLAFLSGCGPSSPKDQYNTLVKKERAKGVRNDSLFLGYYFGMPRKNFYEHSWSLNKQGKVMDGQNNVFIFYSLRNGELNYPGSMNFFPDFYQDKIFKMRTEFSYDGWAPWNKAQSADVLLPDVLEYFQKRFQDGNPFITIPDSSRGTVHVKLDGNRRIVIRKYDERVVKADFTDLTVEDEILKASRKNEAN